MARSKNNLKIFDTPDLLSEAACNFIVELSKKSIQEKGRFIISLSGGHTPEKLYSLLATPGYSNKIEWNKAFVFWGDERCVPVSDVRNNSRMAKSLLLDKVNIPEANIFPVPVNIEPVDAAKKYELTIKNFFGSNAPVFDLILLGLGTNGHTASLFPGTSVIHESIYLVKEVYVEEEKMFRITMTALLINMAHNIVFLVTGKEKAHTLNTVLSGPHEPDKCPAQLINPEKGMLNWFADKEAASEIILQ